MSLALLLYFSPVFCYFRLISPVPFVVSFRAFLVLWRVTFCQLYANTTTFRSAVREFGRDLCCGCFGIKRGWDRIESNGISNELWQPPLDSFAIKKRSYGKKRSRERKGRGAVSRSRQTRTRPPAWNLSASGTNNTTLLKCTGRAPCHSFCHLLYSVISLCLWPLSSFRQLQLQPLLHSEFSLIQGTISVSLASEMILSFPKCMELLTRLYCWRRNYLIIWTTTSTRRKMIDWKFCKHHQHSRIRKTVVRMINWGGRLTAFSRKKTPFQP